MERLIELKDIIDRRVKEYHKECLNDEFINGRFWEAKEIQEILSNYLSTPLNENK